MIIKANRQWVCIKQATRIANGVNLRINECWWIRCFWSRRIRADGLEGKLWISIGETAIGTSCKIQMREINYFTINYWINKFFLGEYMTAT